MAKRKSSVGGPRPGSGRPSFLKDPTKKLFILEASHVKQLDQIRKKNKLSGYSAAIRFILDNYSFA